MNKQPTRFFRRSGIIVHGSKLWVSEFVGTLLVASLLIALVALTLALSHRNTTISRNSATITNLQREKIVLEHELEQTAGKVRLFNVVRRMSRGKIADTTVLKIAALVHANSRLYGYDPLLLLAVIHVESVFDPHALGQFRDGRHSGAMGLMQLKIETAREVARDMGIAFSGQGDLFRPEINMVLGIGYLTRLISRFKSFKLGLLAYNQGPGTIRRSLREQTPLSVRYYEKVLDSYYRLQALVNPPTPTR